MTRYFMTIPEAVSLVVQAGAIGGRGQVFVLDMGEPVRIVDLAQNMIRLSGKEPDTDIRIEFVGARPGEKLHEELWGEGEEVGRHAAPEDPLRPPPEIDAAWLEEELAELEHMVEAGDTSTWSHGWARSSRSPKRSAFPPRERSEREAQPRTRCTSSREGA
jgi:FlaA1/EpsC-like NDP-sugar epimerase